jgi:hypothetical protein
MLFATAAARLFVRMFEAKANRTLFVRQMEARASTPVNMASAEPEFVALPDDFQTMRRIRLKDAAESDCASASPTTWWTRPARRTLRRCRLCACALRWLQQGSYEEAKDDLWTTYNVVQENQPLALC